MASRALAVRLTANTDGLSAGLTKGQRDVRGFASQIESMGSKASAVFGGMGAKVAGIFGAGSLAGAAGFGLKLAADAEQAQVAFKVMLGSAADAQKVFKDLNAFAASTPFEFPELRGSAQKLLAFGLSADSLIPTLTAIGDIASGIGAPIEELAELYGKAKVQGRLFAEDINQLTGRGIPITQELAKQFGVAESEVRKLVESGSVGFDNIERAFLDLTTGTGKFAGMMEEQSQTMAGLWSTFQDQGKTVLRTIGEELNKAFDLKGTLQGITGMLSGMEEPASRLSVRIIDAKLAFLEMLKWKEQVGAWLGADPERLANIQAAINKAEAQRLEIMTEPFKAPPPKAKKEPAEKAPLASPLQAEIDKLQKSIADVRGPGPKWIGDLQAAANKLGVELPGLAMNLSPKIKQLEVPEVPDQAFEITGKVKPVEVPKVPDQAFEITGKVKPTIAMPDMNSMDLALSIGKDLGLTAERLPGAGVFAGLEPSIHEKIRASADDLARSIAKINAEKLPEITLPEPERLSQTFDTATAAAADLQRGLDALSSPIEPEVILPELPDFGKGWLDKALHIEDETLRQYATLLDNLERAKSAAKATASAQNLGQQWTEDIYQAVNGLTNREMQIEVLAKQGADQELITQLRSLQTELAKQDLRIEGKSLAKRMQTPQEKFLADTRKLAEMLKADAITPDVAMRAFHGYARELPGMEPTRSPGFVRAGSREAYSAIVRHQEGRGADDMPKLAREQLRILKEIAAASKRTADASQEPVEEVDI